MLMGKATVKDVEQVLDFLGKFGNAPSSEAFQKAKRDGVLPYYFLNELRRLKLDTMGDPSKTIAGSVKKINACFKEMADEGIIKHQEVLGLTAKFANYKWSFGKKRLFPLGARTLSEEVIYISDTLDIVMDYLKHHYRLE